MSHDNIFLALLQPLNAKLNRVALALTKDREEAKDLTSEVILIAYNQFDLLKDHSKFFSYLVSIAIRIHKRKKYRERNRVFYDEEQVALIQDTTSQPDRAAEIRLVKDALQALPEKIQETVILFDIADLPLQEIRNIQGGTLSGVKSRLKRGREMLANMLQVELLSQPSKRELIEPLQQVQVGGSANV